MNPISGLLRADPATRERLLDDLRQAELAEVAFPRPVVVELDDELLASPSLVAVRAVRGLTMEALVHLCHRSPPLPLERVQVGAPLERPVLSPGELPPGARVGPPRPRAPGVSASGGTLTVLPAKPAKKTRRK
jgi:hypothetical protein